MTESTALPFRCWALWSSLPPTVASQEPSMTPEMTTKSFPTLLPVDNWDKWFPSKCISKDKLAVEIPKFRATVETREVMSAKLSTKEA